MAGSGRFLLLGQEVDSIDPLVAMSSHGSGFSGWRYAVDVEKFIVVSRGGVPFAMDLDINIFGSNPDWQFQGRMRWDQFVKYRCPCDGPAMRRRR